MPVAQPKQTAPSAAAPHTQEQLFSPNTTVANAAVATLPWGTSSGPDSLLNVTVPTLPSIITTGIYAVTLTMNGIDFTIGGYFITRFELDVAGNDLYLAATSPLATAADAPATALAATWYLTAGMTLKVGVVNRDGVAARDFNFNAFVQRIG